MGDTTIKFMDIPQSEIHNRPNDVFIEGGGFSQVPYALMEDVRDVKAIGLYAILVSYADWSTGQAHPSRKTLAKRMGYSTCKAVDEALEKLRESGWVDVFPRWGKVDDDGNWSFSLEKKTGDGWGQTSNGYKVYKTKKDTTPYPYRDQPPYPYRDQPPYPYRGHKQEPIEQEPIERENPPVVPPRGDAPAPAKTEPENPSKEVEPAGKQKPAKRNDRGSRLEDGWMPSQKVIDQMRQECPHVNLEYEHRKFTDYWLSVPASKGRKSNWDATWRNWIRRASESRTGGNTPPQETFDYYADMLIQEHRAQQATNSGQIAGQMQWELPQ